MKRKYFSITIELLSFIASKGIDNAVSFLQGLPSDVKVVGFDFLPEGKVKLVLESEEFPEVEEGLPYPELETPFQIVAPLTLLNVSGDPHTVKNLLSRMSTQVHDSVIAATTKILTMVQYDDVVSISVEGEDKNGVIRWNIESPVYNVLPLESVAEVVPLPTDALPEEQIQPEGTQEQVTEPVVQPVVGAELPVEVAKANEPTDALPEEHA